MKSSEIETLRRSFSGPHELCSTSDGKTLFLRRWPSAPTAKASILILHGITAHSGPYGRLLGEPLSQAGFDIWGLDLRGHGLSDGKRGDYPGPDRYERDLAEAVGFVRSRVKLLVVLGHSLGVVSAMVSARVATPKIDGLILLSAARQIRTDAYPPPSGKAVLKALIGAALLRGTPLIEYRRSGQLGLDDPLYNFRYSARFYSSLYGVGVLRLSSMMRAGSLDVPNMTFPPNLKIPILMGVGDRDELFTVDMVRSTFDGIPVSTKEFFVVPGGRHAVFPPGSWQPIVDWLNGKF